MTTDFHALAIAFAIFSFLNGCTKAGDTFSDNDPIRTRQLAGWSIMSTQERTDLRKKMLTMKSYDECEKYIEHHYQIMLERAQDIGSSKPINRTDICGRMKSAGMFR